MSPAAVNVFVTLIVPPTYKFFPIPAPPDTIIAPVAVDVDWAVPSTVAVVVTARPFLTLKS